MAPTRLSALTGRHRRATWLERVAECVLQEPLVDTPASRRAFRRIDERRVPRALLVGIGLCTRHDLGRSLPLDVLGMLLPAERIRRAAGAEELIVLVADRHAMANGFDETSVDRRARETVDVLERLSERCDLSATTVLRASSFHDTALYREILDDTARRVPDWEHDYVRHQLADALYFDATRGPIIKIGWSAGTARHVRRDEVALDHRLRACYGDRVGFLYCKPGRSPSDRNPKPPPYIEVDTDVRVCLEPGEEPALKLANAADRASADVVRGYRRHLKRLAYTYARQVAPLPRAPLEERLRCLVQQVTAPTEIARPCRGVPAPIPRAATGS